MTIAHTIASGATLIGHFTKNPYLKGVSTAFLATVALAPKCLPVGLTMDPVAENKFRKITDMVNEAKVGLVEGSVNVRIASDQALSENACCIGSAWSFGGPLVCFGATWFDRLDDGQDGEYTSWLQAVEALPNQPGELAKHVKNLSLKERGYLLQGVKEYSDRLSEGEVRGILRHELRHAKGNHLFRTVGALALILLLNDALTKVAKALNYRGTYLLLALPGTIAASFWVARVHEREADATCRVEPFKKGLSTFFKRKMLEDFQNRDPKGLEEWAFSQVTSWNLFSSHPNSAQRLATLNSPSSPSPEWMQHVVLGLGVIGALELARQIGVTAHGIYSYHSFA